MDVETLIEAAADHGRSSGEDHETSDLQQLLRASAGRLSPQEFRRYADRGGPAHETYAAALLEDADDVTPATAVEMLIAAAKAHGEDSEPDMEIGDLQQFLRAAWEAMDKTSRDRFLESDAVGLLVSSGAPAASL